MDKRNKNNENVERMEVDDDSAISDESNSDGNGDIDHISDDEEGGIRIGDIYIPPAPKPALTFDSTAPRLIITHIVNENFKSYAGKETLGPFHKSFTAIIGPNGSGKSNVIDSMLFVFGYRATKIRSKNISVLLHSSKKFPNVTSASVAVYFCKIIDKDDENYDVVPNSEIIISRTAFKDNSSHYTLNGKKVQFKQVAMMLRSHGIDLDHNRFLILQGEVEQIAMMKPKAHNEHESGMLEYLEDIIGTSRYKEPIEKLAVKVDDYTELRKEKLNRVRLVEQEKQKLEEPMREAVEQMNLTNTLLRSRNMLLQKYIHETNKLIEEKETEMVKIKENLDKIDENLNKIKEELEEKTKQFKNETQKYDKLRKQKDSVVEKLQSNKRTVMCVQADITQANKKKKNLDQFLEQEKGKLIDFELIPEKNGRIIEDCEKLLTKHKENRTKAEEELQNVLDDISLQTQDLRVSTEELDSKLVQLKNIQREAKMNFTSAESCLKMYLSKDVERNKNLEMLTAQYEQAEKDLQEKNTIHREVSSTVTANEKKLPELQKKLLNVKKEKEIALKEARTLRMRVDEAKEAVTANLSRNAVLNALMEEKRRGNLPGIFGRLGDLGGIDTKYDVAISTCCGALDNIVVDSAETGQACIEFLKRTDTGRATFIALDKVQRHMPAARDRDRAHYPENVPRLYDLVKVKDPRVLPAFYFALRETLVADDLEQATRIAYGRKRYRVVTLQGQIIEIAGTMCGGGTNVIRGRMGSSVRQDTAGHDPAGIRRDEDSLANLTHRLTQLEKEELSLEDTIHNLQKTVQDGKTQLTLTSIQIENLTVEVPSLKARLIEQKKEAESCQVDTTKKERLEAAKREAEEKLNVATRDVEKVDKELLDIKDKINAVSGSKLKEHQKVVDDLTAKITKVSKEIRKLQVAITGSKRDAEASKGKINHMETELKELENNLQIWNDKKKQLTLENGQLQKQCEDLEEEINEGTNEFSGLKEEISKLQTDENTLKKKRLEANDAVNKQKNTIKDFRSKPAVWETEMSKLKLEEAGVEGVPGAERPEPLARHSPQELDDITVEELRARISAQKGRLGDAKPNIQAIQDFKIKEQLFLKRAAELDHITNKRNEMRELFNELKKKRTTDFLCGFNIITEKLKEMYQMITLGGDAELELVDSLDPFIEGITFSVRPPNKSWKNISNLSGGEKTLSSLALVFALHYYKPTPLYVMDEIDAALDFKNVSIVANYIKERTKNAQFIIISLRYNMFEVCNRLVGIYKTEDCTKSIALDNKLPEPGPE